MRVRIKGTNDKGFLREARATRFVIPILYTVVNMLRTPVDDVFTHEGAADVFLKGRSIAIPNGTKQLAVRKLMVGISPNVIIHSVLKAGDVGMRRG